MIVVQLLYCSYLINAFAYVKRAGTVQPSLFLPKFPSFFIASSRKWRAFKTFCWHSSISVAVYSNNLIWHKHLVFPFVVQRSRSKFLALLSLHNKPEPRPSQNGWLGSGCYVAIFVVCDFFVNFRKDSYILAILVGYLLRGLFRGGDLWQLYYKELSMGVKWPFSMPTKWEHLFSRVLRLWIRSLLQIVYLSWLLDKLTIF